MNTRTLPLLFAGLAALALPALAADWPQWRGPDRNDVSKETGLLKSWPKEGPKLLWTYHETGTGYSGPAIIGDRLYICGADDRKEFVLALDVKTGEKVWSTDFTGKFSHEKGDGPRGNPTVDGDLPFAIGGGGELACLERASGKKLWSKSLTGDLGGKLMSGWGYSES